MRRISPAVLLILGGSANFLIAALHVVIIILGAPAYLYFGRADLALLAEQGSPIPALATAALVAVFAVFGLYALSGAGVIRKLPLLTIALYGIGAVYLLRGLVIILDLTRLVRGEIYPLRQTVFSAVALVIGLLYLIGAWGKRGSANRPGDGYLMKRPVPHSSSIPPTTPANTVSGSASFSVSRWISLAIS